MEPDTLCDSNKRVKYLGVDKVREIIITIDEFNAYRGAFEKDGKSADTVLDYIETIRRIIPDEINLPNYFRMSSSELNVLERRCKKALEGEDAS